MKQKIKLFRHTCKMAKFIVTYNYNNERIENPYD